jgi:hypothetical protein
MAYVTYSFSANTILLWSPCSYSVGTGIPRINLSFVDSRIAEGGKV